MISTHAIHANRVADLLGAPLPAPLPDAIVTVRVPRPLPPYADAIVTYYGSATERYTLHEAVQDWIDGGMGAPLTAFAMHPTDFTRGILRTTYDMAEKTWVEWR